MNDCPPHHLLITSPMRGILHHRCIYCKLEYDLPEYNEDRRMPSLKPSRIGTKPQGYWRLHKQEVIEDLRTLSPKEVREKWGMPIGTWNYLRYDWGLSKSRPVGAGFAKA